MIEISGKRLKGGTASVAEACSGNALLPLRRGQVQRIPDACGMQSEVHAMKFNESDARCHRWGVILAGGDGERLLPLTRRIVGDDRPKQFCAIMGKETFLHQTQRRISRLFPRLRTLLVLTRTHEPFYPDEVAAMSSSRLLIRS